MAKALKLDWTMAAAAAGVLYCIHKIRKIKPASGIGFNPFEAGAQRAAAFKRAVTDMTGYHFITTFPEDFDIAERFGNAAIKDTFKRAFRSWRKNPEYLTELVLTLNHKIWQWYQTNKERARVYDECWREADEWAVNHLKGKDLDYYYRTLD